MADPQQYAPMSSIASAHPGVTVRLYQPSDARAIRHISYETADRGGSINHLLRDQELIADVLTDYYRVHEPSALWVAECDDRIVGYLTGSLKTRHYWQRMTWPIIPAALMRGVTRGLLWQRQIWRLARAGLETWWRGGLDRGVNLAHYPAHLHINVREGFRNHHVGRLLVEHFIEQVHAAGLPGIHAGVREDNVAACRFFERLGFRALHHHPVVLPTPQGYQLHYTMMYGKRLS